LGVAEIDKGKLLEFCIYNMAKAGKTRFTEFEIQKAIYILQATGVIPPVYTYNGYFRGPISNDLKDDIQECRVLEKKEGYFQVEFKKAKKIIDIGDIRDVDMNHFEKLLNQVILDSSEEELSYLAKLLEISKSPPSSRLFLR